MRAPSRRLADGTGGFEQTWRTCRAYGDTYLQRGTRETGDPVRWMTAHRWEYPSSTLAGRVQRALFGWMIKTGQ